MSQIDALSMFTFDLSPDLRIPELPGLTMSQEQEDSCIKKNSKFVVASQKVKKASSYTKVIHDLAENPHTDKFISWSNDGKFLYVRDSTQLCGELERGKYFRSSKFASIVRNLNYHCFRKLRFDELDTNLREELDSEVHLEGARHLFYHPYFQRGRPDLLQLIKSQKTDADKKREEKKAVIEQTKLANNDDSVDSLTLRLEFARKEADYIHVIAQKDQLLAEKDAEIAALRSEMQYGNKRKLPAVYSNSGVTDNTVTKQRKSVEGGEDFDVEALFDDLSNEGFFGDEDLPDMIKL